MAYISRRHGFLFIMAPRTGCTAIGTQVLEPVFGAEEIPEHNVTGSDGLFVIQKKHATLRQLLAHGFLDHEEADRLLKFVAVRNPFDSLVSLYAKQRTDYAGARRHWVDKVPGYLESMEVAADHSFPDWLQRYLRPPTFKGRVRDRLPGLHYRRHLYARFIDGVDVVMKFETLQQDFDAVLHRLGLPPAEIPQFNVTEGREHDALSYRSYYDKAARALVERRFKLDLDRFGYSF